MTPLQGNFIFGGMLQNSILFIVGPSTLQLKKKDGQNQGVCLIPFLFK
jgi:hypothetical protein